MPHLHIEPGQHDFTTSAFIVRTDTPETTIMLHLHRKLAKYLQFGGHIELNEHPWHGLVREIREESGYSPEDVSVLQPPSRFEADFTGTSYHPVPCNFNTHREQTQTNHFHSDLVYAMVADHPPRLVIDAQESHIFKLFTASELKALNPADIYDQTRANALYVLETILTRWEPLPATHWKY